MYDSFLGFINDHQLILPSNRVLLAVSGGLDSVVMADLFAQAPFKFAIAHVNFGMRRAESDADETFVADLASRLNVPFHRIRFDTQAVATQRGLSIQLAARELRYEWFETLANEHGYTHIATAHHQNDVLETLLLNLIRGTGLAGLRSIPIRQGRIVRPLWFASRDEISTYADGRNLIWRDDASNQSDKYARNRLRHQVVPVMQSMNPDLFRTFGRTVERLRAAEHVLGKALSQSWTDCVEVVGVFHTINLTKLTTYTEWPFQLSEWLKPFGFSYGHAQDINRVVGTEKYGQVFRSGSHGVWHDRSGLIIAPLSVEEPFDLALPMAPTGQVQLPDGRQMKFRLYSRPDDFTLLADVSTAYLDADQLPGALRIRRWQQGDRFQPLNMKGTKLVSDLLNDRKVSLPERSRTAVLVADDQILWVIGHRVAHAMRVTPKTSRVLEITLIN